MVEKFKKLLSHTLIYGLGSYAGRVVNFLLLPVYTRYLTPQDYGVLSLVGVLGQILFIFLNMGQSTSLFRFYFRHDDEEKRMRVISTAFLLLVGVSLPLICVPLMATDTVAQLLLGNGAYGLFIWLGCLTILCKVFLRIPFAIMRAREQSTRYAVWSSVQTLLTASLAIALVVGWQQGVMGVLLSQFLAELVLCLLLLGPVLYRLPLRFSTTDARGLLSFGLPLIPAGVAGFVLDLSDRYFLKHYTDLHQVGLYSLGYRFGEIIYLFVGAFQLAWPPFVFANEKAPNAPSLYAQATTYYFTAIVFLCLVVSVFARELIFIMATPAFYDAYKVVPLIALSGLFEGLTFVGGVGINLQNKTIYRPFIVGAAALLNLALNVLLIPSYGMMGAATATVLAFLLQSLLTFAIALRFYSVPYQYLRLAKVALIGLGIYGLSLFVSAASLPQALAEKALLVLFFPLLLRITGFFQPAELSYARVLLFNVKTRLAVSRQ
jgi:O-antigen/teichoic acid export membrane protein